LEIGARAQPPRGGGVCGLNITVLEKDINPKAVVRSVASMLNYIFGQLWAIPLLEELKLDFSSLSVYRNTKVGNPGPPDYWMARLAFLDTLHTVSLELRDNEVGDQGATALSELRHLGTLKTLYLGLNNTGIGPSGTFELAKFRDAPVLESLHLDLEDNRIGNLGAMWLSEFEFGEISTSLRTLHLVCKNNGIGDDGALGLSALVHADHLRHLYLNLDQNLIGDSGLSYINYMSANTTTTKLTTRQIQMKDNPSTRQNPFE
jgi:hypothetical protein